MLRHNNKLVARNKLEYKSKFVARNKLRHNKTFAGQMQQAQTQRETRCLHAFVWTSSIHFRHSMSMLVLCSRTTRGVQQDARELKLHGQIKRNTHVLIISKRTLCAPLCYFFRKTKDNQLKKHVLILLRKSEETHTY